MESAFVSECGEAVEFTSSQVISAQPCRLLGVFVASSTSGTLQVFDNGTTNSGTKIANTFNGTAGTFYPLPAKCYSGCYIAVGGTIDATAFVVR